LVKQGLEQLENQQQYAQFKLMLLVPMVQDVLDSLKDGLSKEVFIYGSKQWTEALQVYSKLQAANISSTIRMAMRGGQPAGPPGGAIVKTLLEQKNLRVPVLVIGFRVSDKARTERLLESLMQMVNAQPLPVKIEKGAVGKGTYYTLKVDGKMI